MLADISSSSATKYGMTLKIIRNVGRSSTILYGCQVLNILEEKKKLFLFFSPRFFVSSSGMCQSALGVKFTLILEKHPEKKKKASQKPVRGQ